MCRIRCCGPGERARRIARMRRFDTGCCGLRPTPASTRSTDADRVDCPNSRARRAVCSRLSSAWKRSSGSLPPPMRSCLRARRDALQAREEIALAFVALLQRLPPKQRAVLLLKDVVGWTSEEIAPALELSVSSVSSALHRGRETLASAPRPLAVEPPLGVLNDYLLCWEERDLDGLVGRLRENIVFAMPPFTNCFRGSEAVRDFLAIAAVRGLAVSVHPNKSAAPAISATLVANISPLISPAWRGSLRRATYDCSPI